MAEADAGLSERRQPAAMALAMPEREDVIDSNGRSRARMPRAGGGPGLPKVWDDHPDKHSPHGLAPGAKDTR